MGAYEGFNAVVPVTFGRISGRVSNGQLWVSWQTLVESNNSYFEIEASTDGNNFTKIGSVPTQAIEGNSSQPLNYEFSMEAAGIGVLMGIGPLVLLVGSLKAKRRKRKAIGFFVLCFVVCATVFVSCNKKKEILNLGSDKPLFVRIIQVDKDGKRTHSKLVIVSGKLF